MRTLGTTLTLVLLISDMDPKRGDWLSDEGMKKAKTFADGLGPAKALFVSDPTLAKRAHTIGLSLTPYTFRKSDVPAGQTLNGEMLKYLYDIGVDAVFTDNPDQFPRK
jgi:glycerophosphoryl diester phosphodiesterase